MRGLLRRAEQFGRDSLFTADALAAAVRRFTGRLGHDPRADIARYVERGESIPADSAALGPCAALREIPFGPFDLGFDVSSLNRSAALRGVDRESNAYRAGLRDGQRLRSISYAEGAATRPVRITIADTVGGAERTIEYLPQGAPWTLVPQYEVRAGCSMDELRRGLL
jgi:predicted metalloprotease with PDZ domain